MPKGKGSASKKTQPECDLYGDTICSTSQGSLQCEVCQSYIHRYCAGIPRSHYHELCSKSTPFVCMVCLQRSQRAIIKQLQDEVSSLRSELDKLRKADSLEPLATPETNKAALDALKDDVQQLKPSIHAAILRKTDTPSLLMPRWLLLPTQGNRLINPLKALFPLVSPLV